jgi:hypothetical protein
MPVRVMNLGRVVIKCIAPLYLPTPTNAIIMHYTHNKWGVIHIFVVGIVAMHSDRRTCPWPGWLG